MSENLRMWRVGVCLGGWLLASSGWFGSAAQAGVIPHSTIQAVNEFGASVWTPVPGATLRGIVINNPWDMLDYSDSAKDPQWQVFIQAVDAGDYGGTVLYMRKNIPRDSSQNYTVEEWSQEMERVNSPGGVAPPLQRGDLIEVVARAPGLFYNGKFNINEKHLKTPENDFDIEVLERGLTPAAAPISLTGIMNAEGFIFDQTRRTGAEHYQGSLVRLEGLTLDDPANWALDGTVTVRQGDLTMPLKLGLDPNLLSADLDAMRTLGFSVTAIMDQEDKVSTDGYMAGYRLWLTNAGDLNIVPEPGTVWLALLGAACAAPVARRYRRNSAPRTC